MNLSGLPGDVKDKVVRCLDMYNRGKAILLVGETGVGKSFLAREVHRASKWRNGNFIPVDLSSVESELFELELFGYENGAFTGARKNGKSGLVDQAQGGTLFFDEIGNLDLRFQKKFLVFLDEKRYRRLGGEKYIKLEAGVIFATNVNLERAISQGMFREDLYFRIKNCTIKIPPLRDRIEYLEEIIKNLIRKEKLRPLKFTRKAIDKLKEYPWPGNIRELLSYLTYWSVQGIDIVKLENLPEEIKNHGDDYNYRMALRKYKWEFVVKVLKISNWNINKAAKMMGISRQHIYRLIKELGIDIGE